MKETKNVIYTVLGMLYLIWTGFLSYAVCIFISGTELEFTLLFTLIFIVMLIEFVVFVLLLKLYSMTKKWDQTQEEDERIELEEWKKLGE